MIKLPGALSPLGSVLLAAGLSLVLFPGTVWAQHKEAAGGTGHKFKVSLNKDGKVSEREFDTSKAEEREELAHALQADQVESMEVDKEFDLFAMLRWDLGLWSLVVFVLLLYILGKLAWKPMLEGLQKREETIRGAIQEAQTSRQEAQRLREQFQAEMNQAQEKVRDLLDAGRRDAQRAADEMLTKTRGEIQTERDRMRREIEMARDQALHQLWSHAAQLATSISTKALRREVSPDDHRRLVDEALTEMSQKGALQRR